ncbi:SDR family oxidoreductase [Pseudoflavonifractor capillosus]|uniref:SDR family oxidoreductase n=1 Tax=Pseudoflavonifractor capillosus TaxID=106588 RepID=A0A921STI4_9FIRM|nr:SDR family oxidoreductase [Pseudoflavonifractor capillosus]HJG87696.1 SDR family oxidoreductase [Pseudoflavonifractor capillosus]
MEQRTALITGASRGIGAATARRLARAGYAVAVNYCRSEERALALVEELREAGHTAMAVHADVSDPDQVGDMVDNVLDKFCQLDILVCNAGRSWVGLLGDMTPEEWRELFAVNLDSVFYCCKAVMPHMIHRKRGKIITISSMWGQVGASCEAAYSASKAGVIGLTKALAKELGPSGITVNCVAPGVVDTEMNQNLTAEDLDALRQETPLERIGRAEDVAESVLFLASEGADFITGQVICPNGGLII